MSEIANNERPFERHQELQETLGKWSMPEAYTTQQDSGSSLTSRREQFLGQKIAEIKPEHGTHQAQIVELHFTTQPGDGRVYVEFTLDINPHDYDVITAGSHMWSQSTSVKTSHFLSKLFPLPTNRVVGRRPYQESLNDTQYRYYEPGFDVDEKSSAKEGRSYGFVTFRHKQTGNNFMLGTIPRLDTFESISYGVKDGKLVVSVQKDFEGITTPKESAFKIFLGSVHSEKGKSNYANLLEAYAQELAKIKGDVPILENSVIGFSWPAYGHNINQEIIEQEVEAGKGIVDTYIIDAGWTAGGANPPNVYEVDTKKFPDLPALAQKIREAGIKPGIWVAPFALYQLNNIPEFLKPLRNTKGKPATSPFPIREDYKLSALVSPVFGKNPGALDISIPEVRNYISQQFVDLAKMGFEVFKLDFLSHAFAAKMERHDKTSIEYYRQAIQEIREAVREQLGKEIALIGCGGPWMESIGLFNGVRMTPDSSVPLPKENMTGRMKKAMIDLKLNTHLYRDATAVAARRIIPFARSFGMIFDGVHIDINTPLGGERKIRYNKSILALRKLGFSNMFVGDSLANLPSDVKREWLDFVQSFKTPDALNEN